MRSRKGPLPRASRIPMKIIINMDDGRHSIVTFCRNLSEGGMFLECLDPPLLGASVKIDFVLPSTMRKVTVQARVAWVKREREGDEYPGIGVRFEGVSESLLMEIKSAVDYLEKLAKKVPV
jgi:uncharacterized protein (TIGR02266 family)